MRSWKTTLSGAVTSAATLALTLTYAGVDLPKWLPVTAGFVLAGGLASLGVAAKDSNVSGVRVPPGGDHADK